jgi:hypothetical protein
MSKEELNQLTEYTVVEIDGLQHPAGEDRPVYGRVKEVHDGLASIVLPKCLGLGECVDESAEHLRIADHKEVPIPELRSLGFTYEELGSMH